MEEDEVGEDNIIYHLYGDEGILNDTIKRFQEEKKKKGGRYLLKLPVQDVTFGLEMKSGVELGEESYLGVHIFSSKKQVIDIIESDVNEKYMEDWPETVIACGIVMNEEKNNDIKTINDFYVKAQHYFRVNGKAMFLFQTEDNNDEIANENLIGSVKDFSNNLVKLYHGVISEFQYEKEFHQLIKKGEFDQIKYILNADSWFAHCEEPGSNGMKAIHRAIQHQDEQLIDILLEKGANVNIYSVRYVSPLKLCVSVSNENSQTQVNIFNKILNRSVDEIIFSKKKRENIISFLL